MHTKIHIVQIWCGLSARHLMANTSRDLESELKEKTSGWKNRRSLSKLFYLSRRLRSPGMQLQEATIKLCFAMLICLSLACVWPWSVHNYSSLAMAHKLIMKDKQEFCVSAPKSFQITYQISATVNRAVGSGLGVLSEDNPVWSNRVFLLTSVWIRLFCFPLIKRRRQSWRTEKSWMRGKIRSSGMNVPVYGGDSASFHHSLHCRSPH